MTALTHRGLVTVPRSPWVGHRAEETWLVDVLDSDDRYLGPLTGVTAGGLDFSVHAEIRSTGSLTVTNPGRVDWHDVRLQVRYRFRDEAAVVHVEPLGVFLPTTPQTEHGDTGSTAEVEIYDKMSILAGDEVPSTWTADKGRTVVAAVVDVLATVGEDDRVLVPEDDGGTLTSAMVWEPGTTKLRIINDILAAGNFFSIWVDGEGLWRLDPYVEATRRGVAWEHLAGPDAIFTAQVRHSRDTFKIPNQVIIVGRAEQRADGTDLPAPVAVAENNNPSDPFSIPRRSRVISVREDEQDATSETVLGQIAARRLLELSSVTSTYELTHAFVPTDLNAAVRLRWPARSVDALAVLQRWSWSWEAGGVPGMVSSTLREVRA